MTDAVHKLPAAELAVVAQAAAGSAHLMTTAELIVFAVAADAAVHTLPDAESIGVGPWIDGVPAVSPKLLAGQFQFTAKNAYFQLLQWEPNGKIRFRCENTSGGADVISPWSAEGTTQTFLGNVGTMVVGQSYKLQIQIDAIPDVPPWDEGAWVQLYYNGGTPIAWTQPGRFDPPVEGDIDPTE